MKRLFILLAATALTLASAASLRAEESATAAYGTVCAPASETPADAIIRAAEEAAVSGPEGRPLFTEETIASIHIGTNDLVYGTMFVYGEENIPRAQEYLRELNRRHQNDGTPITPHRQRNTNR